MNQIASTNEVGHVILNKTQSILGLIKKINAECENIDKIMKEIYASPYLFISPTGLGIRKDLAGHGNYLASRGKRLHLANDYEGDEVGQGIVAPLFGEQKIVQEWRPYKNDNHFTGLLIESDWIMIKMFYVAPIKNIIGKTVKQGDVIATLQDIRKKYPNDPDMKLHCHVEVVSLDLEILRGF